MACRTWLRPSIKAATRCQASLLTLAADLTLCGPPRQAAVLTAAESTRPAPAAAAPALAIVRE